MSEDTSLKEFERIKKIANEQKEKRSRISGQIDFLKKSLSDMGFTQKEAEVELVRLKKELKKSKTLLDNAIQKFKDDYNDKLQQ